MPHTADASKLLSRAMSGADPADGVPGPAADCIISASTSATPHRHTAACTTEATALSRRSSSPIISTRKAGVASSAAASASVR